MAIVLPYNRHKLYNDLFTGNEKYSIHSDQYRATKIVQWLEKHVGLMAEKKSGEQWHGDGWLIISAVSGNGEERFDFTSNVVIAKEIDEELQTDFLLRFG